MSKRNILRKLLAGLSLVYCAGAVGAEIGFQLDQRQGFNFSKDAQTPVGYVSTLKIGQTVLAADFAIKDPLSATAQQVVGVLTAVSWAGGRGDPISFQMQISTANKQKLAALLHQTLKDTSVETQFRTYGHDPIAKTYYVSFKPTAATGLKGLVQKNGTLPLLGVARAPGDTVKSPQNWGLGLSIVPQPVAQAISYSTAKSQVVAKNWGIAAGGK